ncbi:hypothetical protein HPB48_015928 [Haemaphysalis longicornis]|uniref:AMP-binding enzyme C-terminal domain-containing protein n=1 Tax=Haemaphysalis longicornis TaxID=44386 RepID=A0A9J6GXG4_HAELO|nr:hypothetical protein HPB48_015928 [Haemaphysalis longicornis]
MVDHRVFFSGDLGYYDAEEWLYVVQRMNDFFFCCGNKVTPGEIEAVLLKCPEVQECGVVGIPDAEAPGHFSHAAVILKPGATISGPELFRAICKGLVLVEAFPYTSDPLQFNVIVLCAHNFSGSFPVPSNIRAT